VVRSKGEGNSTACLVLAHALAHCLYLCCVLVQREAQREAPENELANEVLEFIGEANSARFRSLDDRTVAVGRKCLDVLQILDKNFGHSPSTFNRHRKHSKHKRGKGQGGELPFTAKLPKEFSAFMEACALAVKAIKHGGSAATYESDKTFFEISQTHLEEWFALPGHALFRRLGLPLSWRPFGLTNAHRSRGEEEGEEGASEPRLDDALRLCDEAEVDASGFIDYVGAWRDKRARGTRVSARADDLEQLEEEMGGGEPDWDELAAQRYPAELYADSAFMRAEFIQFAREKWDERFRGWQAMQREQAADMLAAPTIETAVIAARRLGTKKLVPLPISGAQDLMRAVDRVWVEQARRRQARKEKEHVRPPSLSHSQQSKYSQHNPHSQQSQGQNKRAGSKFPRNSDPRFNLRKQQAARNLQISSFSYARAVASPSLSNGSGPVLHPVSVPSTHRLNPQANAFAGGEKGSAQHPDTAYHEDQYGRYAPSSQPFQQEGVGFASPGISWEPGVVNRPNAGAASWEAPGLSWDAQLAQGNGHQTQASWSAQGVAGQQQLPWEYQSQGEVGDYNQQYSDPRYYQDVNPQYNPNYNPLMGETQPQPYYKDH
jgi:hypothetical protein